jgi:hypothetical protein
MFKRTLTLIALVALGFVAAPTSASAADSPYSGHRFRYPLVCVQQDVDASLGLVRAAALWNEANGIRFFVRGDRWHPNGCAGITAASQTVVARYYSDPSGDCAFARVWAAGGFVTRAEVHINLSLLTLCTGNDPARKAAMMVHELGHSAGLAHASERTSIMCNGSCALNLGPSALDRWRMHWRYTH